MPTLNRLIQAITQLLILGALVLVSSNLSASAGLSAGECIRLFIEQASYSPLDDISEQDRKKFFEVSSFEDLVIPDKNQIVFKNGQPYIHVFGANPSNQKRFYRGAMVKRLGHDTVEVNGTIAVELPFPETANQNTLLLTNPPGVQARLLMVEGKHIDIEVYSRYLAARIIPVSYFNFVHDMNQHVPGFFILGQRGLLEPLLQRLNYAYYRIDKKMGSPQQRKNLKTWIRVVANQVLEPHSGRVSTEDSLGNLERLEQEIKTFEVASNKAIQNFEEIIKTSD